jgi:glycine hydroxymethyltransferase
MDENNFLKELSITENLRNKNTLNLIASENYPSLEVMNQLKQSWSLKYGEGYPGKRYYAGNENTDKLEKFVMEKALEVFEATGEYSVNLQIPTGSLANAVVYLSVLNEGDTILSLNLADGGHLSHLHPTSVWNKYYNHIIYSIKESENNSFEIDIEDYERQIKEHKPKLVIIGCSSYPKQIHFAEFIRIAHENNVLVLADIAHIAGLVAAKLHPTPFGLGLEGADFITMTTHKTFRGPRGAMLFTKYYLPPFAKNELGIVGNSLIDIVNKTVFPGMLGGPNFATIAGIGQACLEILGDDEYPDKINFNVYAARVIENAKLLENKLKDLGVQIISPTENHLLLIKLPDENDSIVVQENLESIGIILNRNSLPKDQKNPWRPSGLRIGMSALTSRGISQAQVIELASIIADTIFESTEKHLLIERVHNIADNLAWWYV